MTVAVWLGDANKAEGVIKTREVWGLPHDSGREELDGQLFITELLKEVEAKRGTLVKVKV